MSTNPVRIVEKKAEKILSPFNAFIESQFSTSVGLAIATLLAIVITNSTLNESFQTLIHAKTGFIYEEKTLLMPVKEWVNSGLMAFFFFLLGLELKREVFAGELKGPKKFGLVLMAAIGGMVLPALFFSLLNLGSEYQIGWAIPMATDTAFAIGLLGFLTRKASRNLFVFLTGLAIFDDLGAIVVIAIYYSKNLDMTAMGTASVFFALLIVSNLSGFRNGWVYFLLGTLFWWYVHESGVHGTLAGVLIALSVPARTRSRPSLFAERVKRLASIFAKRMKNEKTVLADQEQFKLLNEIKNKSMAVATPLQRWESSFEAPVGLLVLPIFALCNAGIRLSEHNPENIITSPLAMGIILGLVVGKPIGIWLFSWLAVRSGLGVLPTGVTFNQILGLGMLAGIGFTMSLFISLLAFPEDPNLVEQAKLGILLASLISGTLGFFWLSCQKEKTDPENTN